MTADNDGADSSERNPYYKAVYDAVQASIRAGGPAKGALFWEWVVRSDGEVLDVAWPDGRHPYGVSVNDATFMCAHMHALGSRGPVRPAVKPVWRATHPQQVPEPAAPLKDPCMHMLAGGR